MVEPIATIGQTDDGQDVQAIAIAGGGLHARVLTWGATLQSLGVDGAAHSVILGSPNLDAYRNDMLYFGAIVGPVANRVAGGRLPLDGTVFELDRNENGKTTLHGGSNGFGQRNWSVIRHGADFVTLGIEHPSGLSGFPGPISVEATYHLLEDQVLQLDITGLSGAMACFAPAFHGYWNLDGSTDILSHRLTIDADRYTPVDDALLPLGTAAPVEGTAFDYRQAKAVAPDLDHNFCTGAARGALRKIATLQGQSTALEIESTEPGLQVYSAGFTSSGAYPGLDGKPFGRSAGIALEPQIWPDAPNNPSFPTARIEPGERITQVSRFRLIST